MIAAGGDVVALAGIESIIAVAAVERIVIVATEELVVKGRTEDGSHLQSPKIAGLVPALGCYQSLLSRSHRGG